MKKIQSGAYRTAQELKGKADAETTAIYTRAYNQKNESRDFQGPLTRMYLKLANNGKEVSDL